MSFLKTLKANKPVASLEGYFMAMLAPSKFGKTTWSIDTVRAHYKGAMDKALLLATEIGYKTMDGVYAIPVTGFDFAEEEDGEQKGFIEVVDELVDNKDDIPFRFIIIDTITALERYAVAYAIRKANRDDQPQKRYTDISDIPWGKGYTLVAEHIYQQIDRLKKAGFGVLVIGHSKTKKIKNRDGYEYDYTGLNVLGKTSDIIEREADMIMYGDIMVKEGKDGKPETTRVLRFRSDGNILCGTRFRNFPAEISNDPEEFLAEFKKAVEGSTIGDTVEKVKEVAKDEKSVVEEPHEHLAVEDDPEAVAMEEIHKIIESVKAEIGTLVKGMDKPTKIQCAEKFKELLGQADYRKSEDLNALAEALDFVKSLA
ncbi:P-loop containing nucleoside triphosphate hydrolase [Bacillus phage Kirov]|uniref:P-loop containing nucleoside triphosphate hydrolase n=1 Tax=Bacillus phage Kirov TaxID=2783539 RepID=A0A7U3RXR3_9CAUD|nr:P-loop containing nucleoside triphosphate hydrolase [Bacillus phage Kirov]QOV08371.1 P-loop containing nucleoside triphosphate hydrolase [Bacillus phage Kirov]